jgi:hypothetical protein
MTALISLIRKGAWGNSRALAAIVANLKNNLQAIPLAIGTAARK